MLDNKQKQYKVDSRHATTNLWIEVEGFNFNVYLVLIILRWRIAKIQTDLLQRRLQMFVLAISKPISKAVGIHQHSNNVPWHPKAICNISERDKKKTKKHKRLLFLVSFCSQTEHLEFLFEEIQKQIRLWGLQSFSRSLREPHLSSSITPFPPCCVWR